MQETPDRNRRAGDCCSAIRRELGRLVPVPEKIVYGPDLAASPEAAAQRLRARGAHFYWVALPLGRLPFFDAHVGVVLDPAALTGTAGVHWRRGSAAANLLSGWRGELRKQRLSGSVSEAADEEQWNGALHDFANSDEIAKACRESATLLATVEGWLTGERHG